MRGGVALAGLGLAATLVGPAAGDEAYRESILKWRQAREARLKADGGWLTLAGLFWLKPGDNRFGTDPSDEITLPPGSGPAHAGAFIFDGSRTVLRLASGVTGRVAGRLVTGPRLMQSDAEDRPDVLELGSLSLYVIRRDGRYGMRVKDKNSPVRRGFTGLRWFDVREDYRVEAKWVSYPQPRPLRVPNVLGETTTMPSPGYAEFTLDGQTLRLDGVLEEPTSLELFFILRDQTSGKETYGAGRFLYADLPKQGRVVLDFNKAYNPPCAFTPYATCPLPPKQNWLPVRVEAGEMAYTGPGHH
jgi:uncharacterized protein (DUF1684 family)